MPDLRPLIARPSILLALQFTAVLGLLLLWDWNWFKPLVEKRASRALGRSVQMQHFDLHLGAQPQLVFEGLRLANPEGFAADLPLATVRRITVKLEGSALWHRLLRLLEIRVQGADADLWTREGKSNWKLAPETSGEAGFFKTELGHLLIEDSRLRFRDPALKSDFTARVRTLAGQTGSEDLLRAELDGRYNGEPVTGYLQGGALLDLRKAEQPYPLHAELATGATRLSLHGSIERPRELGGAQLRMTVKGPNLGLLYALTGYPLPETPPYHVSSAVTYAPGRIQLDDLKGALGSSDIAGQLVILLGAAKPRLSGKLHSRQVSLSDLAGFIGATPTGQQPAQPPPAGRVLPDQKFNIPKLKAADMDLQYSAARIVGRKTPLDKLDAHVSLIDGRYSFTPLRFAVGEGEISIEAKLDAHAPEARLDAEIRFRQVNVGQLLDAVRIEAAGAMTGRISLKSRGNSVAQLWAVGNGEAQLFMASGNLPALLVDIAGIDLGNSVVSLLGLPRRTEINCMVADLGLKDGLLGTRLMLVDTATANVRLDGALNFKDESLDYRLRTRPKRLNFGSLAAPILIRGTLKNPSVRPDLVRLGGRAAIAVGFGALLGPLAALLPTLQFGRGEDSNCQALLADVQQQAKAPVALPPKPRTRRKP